MHNKRLGMMAHVFNPNSRSQGHGWGRGTGRGIGPEFSVSQAWTNNLHSEFQNSYSYIIDRITKQQIDAQHNVSSSTLEKKKLTFSLMSVS